MPKVSIVKCSSYKNKEVLKAVSKAIDDIKFKIKHGSKVILKPNILMGARQEKGITTHPAILEALCRILKKKKCKITIAESFGVMTKSSDEVFRISGMQVVAEKFDVPLVSFSASEIIEISNAKAAYAKKMRLPSILFDADLIINLPKLKTHTLMYYTGAVKNLFGCIPGARKQAYHSEANTKEKFANMLLDIWMNVKPKLNIMDAVVGMEGEGPSNGNLKEIGLILASDDSIAMDLVAERIIGFEGKVPTNNMARKRELIDEKKIEVIGDIQKIDFEGPGKASSMIPPWLSGFMLKQAIAYPSIIKEKCTRCWTCVKVCPVDAMEKKGFPSCDKKKCIACYCCHELCPYHAIRLKRHVIFDWVIRIYSRIWRTRKK